VDARPARPVTNGKLEGAIQHVMAPQHPGVGVQGKLAGREKPEPLPGGAGARVFALQRFGQPPRPRVEG
jgi:hypothetical protein